MNISEIASESITALGLVPDEDVLIDVVNPDWDGGARIYIVSEQEKPEDQTQFGVITSETVLRVFVLSKSRNEAKNVMHATAHAVYKKFTEMEQTPGSGVLCITLVENNTTQIPERKTFNSFVAFRILHKPTL
jgi:hypothetical protein